MKKSQPKTKTGVQKGPSPNKRGLISLAMQTCSVTNPFCPEAIAARWPDDSYSKSVGWSVPGTPVTLTTAASSSLTGMLFVGDLYNTSNPTNATPLTSGPLTFTTLAPLVTVPTGIARYRITSWGIKLTGIVAPLSAGGIVRIRLFSPMSGTSLSSISTFSTAADAIYDVPLSRFATKDVFITPASLGSTPAHTFRDFSLATTTLSSWTNPGWQVVLVSVEGATASSALLQAQVFAHYELVFVDGDSQTQFAKQPPANNPAVRDASANVFERVGNFVEGTVATVDKLYQSRAMQYLTAGAMAYGSKSPAPLLALMGNTPRIVD